MLGINLWFALLIANNVVLGLTNDDVLFPFQNISLSWDERVDDLVSRLTIDEIIAQLAHGGDLVPPAPAIPRLGILQWAWNTECLHGDVN